MLGAQRRGPGRGEGFYAREEKRSDFSFSSFFRWREECGSTGGRTLKPAELGDVNLQPLRVEGLCLCDTFSPRVCNCMCIKSALFIPLFYGSGYSGKDPQKEPGHSRVYSPLCGESGRRWARGSTPGALGPARPPGTSCAPEARVSPGEARPGSRPSRPPRRPGALVTVGLRHVVTVVSARPPPLSSFVSKPLNDILTLSLKAPHGSQLAAQCPLRAGHDVAAQCHRPQWHSWWLESPGHEKRS